MLRDHTNEPLMRLLVDATRRAHVHGPALADAHRAVGRALAADVAKEVVLQEVAIDHVAGQSTGVRIEEGAEPIIVAILRAGLFLAEGVWEALPSSALVPHHGAPAGLATLPCRGRPVVVVDSVVNSGRSLREVLDVLVRLDAGTIIVATLVGFRPTMEALIAEYPSVQFIAARLSERSYVGRGGTDTGARLFGTTNWQSER